MGTCYDTEESFVSTATFAEMGFSWWNYEDCSLLDIMPCNLIEMYIHPKGNATSTKRLMYWLFKRSRCLHHHINVPAFQRILLVSIIMIMYRHFKGSYCHHQVWIELNGIWVQALPGPMYLGLRTGPLFPMLNY